MRYLAMFVLLLAACTSVKPTIQQVKREEVINLISIRDTIALAEKNGSYGKVYDELVAFLEKNGGEFAGVPLVMYHLVTDSTLVMEWGAAVKGITEGNDRVTCRKVSMGNVLKSTHVGNYEDLPKTYKRMFTWLKKNGKQPAYPYWEFYITDPGTLTPKQMKKQLQTEVYVTVGS